MTDTFLCLTIYYPRSLILRKPFLANQFRSFLLCNIVYDEIMELILIINYSFDKVAFVVFY